MKAELEVQFYQQGKILSSECHAHWSVKSQILQLAIYCISNSKN